MTVLPVFVPSEPRDGRQRVADRELSLAGSCLLISPRLALTCDHVCRVNPLVRDDGEIPPQQIVVGTSGRPIVEILRADADQDDLALLELTEPHPFTPVVFSRQWNLDHVHAMGFRHAPFLTVERDGPITLGVRAHVAGLPRSVTFAHGVQNGFSGGPLEGQFHGTRYCIGLSCFGGTARAVAAFIPAAACVAFVTSRTQTKCSLVDLSRRALLDLMTVSERRLEESWCAGQLGDAVLVSSDPFEMTSAPLVHIDAINRSARPALDRGELPDRLAITVSAHDLETFLAAHGADDEPTATLCRFFDQSDPRLRFNQALQTCLARGGVVVAVTGDVSAAIDASDSLSSFLIALRRTLAANALQRRRS